MLDDYGEQLAEEARDYLLRSRAASQRLGQLIDDLLELSRVARLEMVIDQVDLSLLAREAIDALRRTDRDRIIDVTIADSAVVRGDAQLLQLVMQNLIGNAWKFTRTTPGARIEFGVDRSGERPVYFVRDNGAGFEMEYVEKLFKTFQRLHAFTEFPGTGIGLATVKRIIDRHGGRVWAEGEKGAGATFYFEM